MRNISDKIWDDDWFAEQEPTGKLIWIGIISKVADDQGRFRNNADLVKSLLFPMTKTPDVNQVDLWLAMFITDGRLIAYEIGGKKLLQIANWWKYQDASQWMGQSEFPAPEGWQDWYRYQSKGRTIVVSLISKDNAGYGLCRRLDSGLHSGVNSGLCSDKVNDNVKEKENDKDNAPAVPVSPVQDKPAVNIFKLYEQSIGLVLVLCSSYLLISRPA